MRTIALAVLTALAFGIPTPSSAEEPLPFPHRYLGAESGFDEIACVGLGHGCPGFASGGLFGGRVDTRVSGSRIGGETWDARTGRRFFLASVPGGPAAATLSTAGTDVPSVSPLTVSFAVRLGETPVAPLTIFRHGAGSGGASVAIAVAPGGTVVAHAPGTAPAAGGLLLPGSWHAVTIAYGSEPGDPFVLRVDGALVGAGLLPFGGPRGAISLGILEGASRPVALGLDDYVEVAGFDAPVHGARIGFAAPTGQIVPTGWTLVHDPACLAGAQDWELLSEERFRLVDGIPCDLASGWLSTTASERRGLFRISSVGEGPGPGDAVLGVRARMRGTAGGGADALRAVVVDGRREVRVTLPFDATVSWRWGPTLASSPWGAAWTSESLDQLLLRLDSASGPGLRVAYDLVLDRVWVPAG